MDPAEGRQRMVGHHRLVHLLAEAEKPLIAAVEGPAFGAGAGIALLCDLIVASPSAVFGFPFLRVGLVPDYGVGFTLGNRIGSSVARRLLLTGARVEADEALRIGLIDELSLDVLGTATKRAVCFALQPPHALALTKRMLNRASTLANVLDIEILSQSLSYLSPERAEGRQAFLEKREPRY
jgi:2-(1,2-epoxy-1,2-dihydrophenyl)acetyl-CoA isomerase